MTKFRPLLAAALVTATLGGAAIAVPAVFAQAAPPADQAKPMQHRHHADRPAPGQFIEGRIAFLRTELKVTPAQQPLFDRLADEMRGTAKAMEARHAAMQAEQHPASSLERMERRSTMMKAMAADGDRFLAAYRPFYDGLSDAQKKTADLLFARFGGGMGGPDHGMRRH